MFSLLILLLGGCSKTDSENVDNPNGESDAVSDDNSGDDPQDTSFEINIDVSDLTNLPADTGGTHTPHPYGSTEAFYGHYVYTPSGYQENGLEYPLLIFLHGWNPELGDLPLDHVLSGGPPMLIENGEWDPSFPFIVATPQLLSQYWAPEHMHRFIEYLIDTYRINTKRIYLTGLSLGGGGCWYYVGEVDDNYAAAIVPISSAGAEYLVDNLKSVPIWAFHGQRDATVAFYDRFGSVQMVEAVNAANPNVRARVTLYPNLGHDAWSNTYDNSGQFHYQTYDEFKVDIYDWMLSHKKE